MGTLLVLAIVIPQIHLAQAAVGLALDGKGFGSASGGSCVWSQTLTTTKAPDVIVGLLVVNDTTTRINKVSDTASLLWKSRINETGPSDVQIFFYYAIASTPLTAADSMTFVLSSGAVATVCQMFGVSGADVNMPFDPNPGMPSEDSGNLSDTTLNFNSFNPNDFLIILQGFCAQGVAGSGSPAGFTTIVGAQSAHSTPTNCAANFLQTNTYYEIVTSTQSLDTVSWSFDAKSSPFAIIGDAIQSTPGPLSVSVIAGSNALDVGQVAPFSCTAVGGVSP